MNDEPRWTLEEQNLVILKDGVPVTALYGFLGSPLPLDREEQAAIAREIVDACNAAESRCVCGRPIR